MNKVDKGFEIFYLKLSSRRKFLRTLWTIPWCVLALIIIQVNGKNLRQTMIWGILFLLIFIVQLSITYRRWMEEKKSSNQREGQEK